MRLCLWIIGYRSRGCVRRCTRDTAWHTIRAILRAKWNCKKPCTTIMIGVERAHRWCISTVAWRLLPSSADGHIDGVSARSHGGCSPQALTATLMVYQHGRMAVHRCSPQALTATLYFSLLSMQDNTTSPHFYPPTSLDPGSPTAWTGGMCSFLTWR